MTMKNFLQLRKKCYEIGINTISREIPQPDVDSEQAIKEPCFKCRYVVAMIGFLLFFYINGIRMNMSVGIVAMVNQSAMPQRTETTINSCSVSLMNLTNGSEISESMHLGTGEFDWSPSIQGYILGSYYVIYVTAQIPFGKLVERYGSKWFAFGGTMVTAVATLLSPVASRTHPYLLILMQIFSGLGQSTYQPAIPVLVANWFPKMERGFLFTFIYSGGALGGFMGCFFCGLLSKSPVFGGWSSSFYAFGLVGLIFSALILFILHESPTVHPQISEAERKYILSNQENVLTQRRPNPPWRKIFTSVPFYALSIGYFGQNWAMSQFMTMNSIFLGTILHYPIDENGFLTSVSFLLMFLFTLISSWLSSFLHVRKYATVNQVRKYSNFIASLGVSLCLLGIYFSGCNKFWSSMLAVLSTGVIGIGFSGVWIVPTDMSPTFAASVNSVSCTFGCLPNFILPFIVGYLTNKSQTLEQWNIVFFMGIAVIMTCAFVFSIFGSAEVQPWNFVEDQHVKKEDRNIPCRY